MNQTVAKLALKRLPVIRAQYQAYLDECEQYRKEGFRPRTCEHGTDRWTDYDNICGPCEDGWTAAGIGAHRIALDWAHGVVAQTERRAASVRSLIGGPDPIPAELRESLVNWAIAPLLAAS